MTNKKKLNSNDKLFLLKQFGIDLELPSNKIIATYSNKSFYKSSNKFVKNGHISDHINFDTDDNLNKIKEIKLKKKIN